MNQETLLLAVGVLVVYLWLQTPDEIAPAEGDMSLIERFAEAIKTFEGWAPGSRSYRNNNPGNLKGGSWQGMSGRDADGFLIFDSYTSGWNALVYQITMAVKGISSVYSPADSIAAFFHKYAPASDNNQPERYAAYVAQYIGVTPDTQLSQLV